MGGVRVGCAGDGKVVGSCWEREVATGVGTHWARLGRPEDWGGRRLGRSRAVLAKRLCYSEALRLGSNGAGRCGGVGVRCRGAVMPMGKRVEVAWQ